MTPRAHRIAVSRADLEQHFQDQIAFLKKSVEAFDAGETAEFKRIALAARILVYDRGQSRSLATQMGLKGKPFVAIGKTFNPNNAAAEWCLAVIRVDEAGARFVPALDKRFPRRAISFDAWWNETVLTDGQGVRLSRGDIIQVVANQAGGAHVDPEVDQRYHRIAREHTAGLVAVGAPTGSVPADGCSMEHIEKVYLRHIAAELLESFGFQGD